jgi:hypothetical protein
MTPLDKTLKRAISIKGDDYVVTLTPEALKISRKGHRLGVELNWVDLVSGETALAVALRASVGRFQQDSATPSKKPPDSARQRKSPSGAKPLKRAHRVSPRQGTQRRSG